MRLDILYKLNDSLKNFKKKISYSSSTIINDIMHSDILLSASSLVYFTLVSIIPFLVFIVPPLKAYNAFDNIYKIISDILVNIFGTDASSNFIEAVKNYVNNGITLGVMGVFVFGYSSVSLVNRVKKNVNKVYRIPVIKNSSDNIFVSFGKSFIYILVFSFLLILVSLVYSYVYGAFGKNLSGLLSSPFAKRFALDLFVVLLFFLLFTSMPNVYVNPKYSFIGAIFFLIEFRLINLATVIIVKYFFKTKSLVYGSAGYIITGLLWIYMFWAIVIIAVEVSYVLQYRPNAIQENKKTPNEFLQDSLDVMKMIIEGFESGKGGAKLSDISQTLSLSNQEVIKICDKFEEGNLISSIGKLKKRLYAPYCPIENLKLYYILNVIEGDYDHRRESVLIMDEINEIKITNFQDKKISDYHQGII